MPLVQSTQSTSVSATTGGLSWTQIKEMANKRTDRRAEKTLNLDFELLDVLQDFCSEYQWFWRRLSANISTTAGNQVYDLSDPAITVEKIIKAYYIAGVNQRAQLALVTDEDAMINMLEGWDVPGCPAKFMREPGTANSIRINPPDSIYRMRYMFWALPAMNIDAVGETVPLVPSQYHPILVKGLERNIFRYTIGEGTTKYTAANGEYERLKAKASENRNGVTGVVREYVSNEDGIRSTGLGRSY